MGAMAIQLRRDQYLELEKLGIGAFMPVINFMGKEEFDSVVLRMRLPSGEPFSLPIVLDVTQDIAEQAVKASAIDLIYLGVTVGQVLSPKIYTCDKTSVAARLFGTADAAHPGVDRFYHSGDWFVSGETRLLVRVDVGLSQYELTPAESRQAFAVRGWKTVVGFQTRNVPHRAHEYLQRVALEHVDGLFIQPLVGQKKIGDYTPEAVLNGYQALLDDFYRKDRVMLGVLSTSMRYAGPREALFHALIRRNYGCTHFIVGRDHAGVGGYYEKYGAHDLLRTFEGELGIEIMYLHGPYHCEICDGIVTEHTCPHFTGDSKYVSEISGTLMRQILSSGDCPNTKYIRPEIVAAVSGCKLFIDEVSDE